MNPLTDDIWCLFKWEVRHGMRFLCSEKDAESGSLAMDTSNVGMARRYVCRMLGYSGVNDNLFDVLVGLVFCQLNDGREKSLQ
jgi:hypothetical protein